MVAFMVIQCSLVHAAEVSCYILVDHYLVQLYVGFWSVVFLH